MAFVVWYELVDLNVIGGATNADLAALPVADRNLARKYWNGGVDGWATAPVGHWSGDDLCSLCRQLVITFGTLAEFRALLHRIADALGGDALYLHALADDMGNPWGGQDPFP
jgi:hypothetical protein